MSIYDFNVKKRSGLRFPLYEYTGKVVVIVNTASSCKFTPQFLDLQKVYDEFKDSGVEIIGFPCNQFAAQEPGSAEEAAAFCQLNFGVTFPIMDKTVVNGDDEHPLFTYLKKAAPFQGFNESDFEAKLTRMMLEQHEPQWLYGDAIKWNFTKFLINRDGTVFARYEPTDDIDGLRSDIAKCLSS